ncbi:MAG: catalase [Burkholderiales bacterium]|jgi:catalase|nr:catalase [Burkholderiales bacterium]
MSKCPLTSANGAPVATDQNSISAGERGSLTFDNHHLFEKLAHFNRERIPVEQAAFSPSNLVPGVGVSPDKMLQARLLAYPDAHRYRIGANFNQLDVNRPICPVNNYQRDGFMARNHLSNKEQISSTNYYPNEDANTPKPAPEFTEPPLPILADAWIKAYDTQEEDNFSQAGNLFRLMNIEQKTHLVNNIASGLKMATTLVQEKMLKQFYTADKEYGDMVKLALHQ